MIKKEIDIAKNVYKMSNKEILYKNKENFDNILNELFELLYNHEMPFFDKKDNKENLKELFKNKIKERTIIENLTKDHYKNDNSKIINILLYKIQHDLSSLMESSEWNFLKNVLLILLYIVIRYINETKEDNSEYIYINKNNIDYVLDLVWKILSELDYIYSKEDVYHINWKEYSFFDLFTNNEWLIILDDILYRI